jgi:flagellar biosynthetic protein FlhB
MADDRDDASKTEEPTAKRLDEARRKGQVPLSREVNNWFVLLAATLALAALAPTLAADARRLLVLFLEQPHAIAVDAGGLRVALLDAVWGAARAAGPVLGAVAIAGIGAGVAQIGWLWAPAALAPRLEKLSPLKGLKRLFGPAALLEFAKGMVKLALVGGVAWWVMAPELDRLALYADREVAATLALLGGLCLRLAGAVIAVMTVIAGLDMLWQRLKFRRDLRMTRTELRDEYKEQEGDPMVKAKLKQIRAERSRRRMMQAVPKADVVITNPTHYAVALKYDRERMNAPFVVAKGVDRVALRIREIAEGAKVPVVENPPLARVLHAAVDLDSEIPPEHYKAVAEVIGYVLRLKAGTAPARARAG